MLHMTARESIIILSWLATNQSTRLEFATNVAAGWRDASVKPIPTNAAFVLMWTNKAQAQFVGLRVL